MLASIQYIAEIIQCLEDILIIIDDNDIGVDPMDPEDIEAIPTALMNQEMSDKSSACPICLGSFLKEEEVLVLLCGHFYHAACIKTWLGLHASCPVCRSRQGEEVKGDALDGEENGRVDGEVGRGE